VSTRLSEPTPGRAVGAFDVAVVPTPGLGNNAYLVASDGVAAAIDPPRDAWRMAEVAEVRGWRIRHVLETHVHNDYLSGARELRRRVGAAIVAPTRGGYRFAHHAAHDGFRIELGDIGVFARTTPGHTPEHVSWEVIARDGPAALFSGGSLLVGGVGRTDLLGEVRTDELTEAQFHSMERLAELPDSVVVYPTHGAGSFCVSREAEGPASATIGALRRWNAAFAAPDLAAFERELETGRTRYPDYYRRMASLNRRGPRMAETAHRPRPLSPEDLRNAREAGAWVIDVRDRWAFAERHVAGSMNVELGDDLAAYVGWLVPFDSPICLVVDDPAQEVEASLELMRIGYDHVLGHLRGGVAAWESVAGETSSFETTGWEELRSAAAGEGVGPSRILDVRQPYEWAQGAIPDSRRIFVADLPAEVDSLERDVPWIVACRTGVRAAIAASILDAAGIPATPVADGGVPALPSAELTPA
jgi:glyoxylase-like metal-dependent hydrolase (beta-lactamase superfamily II)